MENIKNTNNYAYDPANIAKALQRAMSQNADPLAVKYLNDARKEKIASGGAATLQYENDALTRAADEYIKSFEKSDVSRLHEARRNTLTDGLKNAHQAAKKAYDKGLEAAGDNYAEARRLFVADEHKKKLDTEEGLARYGLGRGVSSGTTSGVGESTRVKMLADGAEGLKKLYDDEAKTKADLAGKLAADYYAAYEKYADGMDKTYKEQASDSLEADKNYKSDRLELMGIHNDRQESDRDFEYEKRADAKNNNFEKAYKAFEATGIVTSEEQAEILGIPVGTKSFESEKFKQEIAAEERKLETEEKKLRIDKALDLFSKTGEITSEEQAEILGLKLGDKTIDAEKLAFDILYYKTKLDSEISSDTFENAYTLFEAVGSVTTQDMADILGIPVGTKYWKYVTDSIRANAATVNASASSARASAAMQNADTNTYKSETDRLELKTKTAKELKKEIQEKKDAKEV